MLKIDMHVHTQASGDSLTPLEDVLAYAERAGMDGLAITDHNTIVAACELRDKGALPIIVGQEISTPGGELIAYFVEHKIPAGLDPQDAIDRVHAQGGLVGAPHPVDRVRSSALGYHNLVAIIDQLDFVEALNARVTFTMDNHLARDIAQSYRLPMTAGSDAHTAPEIGQAYIGLPLAGDDANVLQRPGVFLHMLEAAQIQGSISSPLVHMGSTYAKAAKRLFLPRTR